MSIIEESKVKDIYIFKDFSMLVPYLKALSISVPHFEEIFYWQCWLDDENEVLNSVSIP